MAKGRRSKRMRKYVSSRMNEMSGNHDWSFIGSERSPGVPPE
jgi:hypothetical protein